MIQRPNGPSPNTFSFEIFSFSSPFFFLERFGKFDFFLGFLKNIYIHEQSTSNATWIFRIQRNIETWNKQKNFKFNHDVTNQMWSEAKLGHLLLLGPFLDAWGLACLNLDYDEMVFAWNGLGLHLEGLNLDYDLLVFAWNGLTIHLEGMHLVSFWPLMLIMRIHFRWAQVLGLDSFKKQFWASIPSRVQS